ncbi:MAG: type II toxin-antitoxin system YhaV family toxin [Xanthomonadales bacterium]|nr:type II toxin-antitoxin system YhaV family toxin [Xanthomonadales bacterium]
MGDAAVQRAKASTPRGYADNANVKLLRALSHLILDVVPNDPANDAYRQVNTLGISFRHWRWAKIGGRFRLFFRYDARAKIIVFAWLNDERSLRSVGSKSDPYTIFAKMLKRGKPPDGWAPLNAVFHKDWDKSA